MEFDHTKSGANYHAFNKEHNQVYETHETIFEPGIEVMQLQVGHPSFVCPIFTDFAVFVPENKLNLSNTYDFVSILRFTYPIVIVFHQNLDEFVNATIIK